MTKTLRIVRDDNPENPRDMDNTGHMICAHRRYKLGDEQRSDLTTAEEVKSECDALVVLPVFMYDHGAQSISTKPFEDRWDSGQLGWIYATDNSIRAIGWVKDDEEITSEVIERVKAALVSEVETYNEYLQGDVWGFIVEEHKTCECCGTVKVENVDSCGGFLGGDVKAAIANHLDDEVKPLLDEAWSKRS